MHPVCQKFRQFKLGGTLTRLKRIDSRRPYTSRGRLPWEGSSNFPEPPQKKFRKCKTEPTQEKLCPYDCEVLKPPKRNSYEWVVEQDTPCKPFGGFTHIVRTIYDTRRLQKCFQIFGGADASRNVSLDCSKTKKVYPMREAIQKGSLPGCVRPIATR